MLWNHSAFELNPYCSYTIVESPWASFLPASVPQGSHLYNVDQTVRQERSCAHLCVLPMSDFTPQCWSLVMENEAD